MECLDFNEDQGPDGILHVLVFKREKKIYYLHISGYVQSQKLWTLEEKRLQNWQMPIGESQNEDSHPGPFNL